MRSNPSLFLAAALTGLVAWAYWPTLAEAADRWAADPQYSHGYLVPLFSGYLLWSRRGMLAAVDGRPGWWGFGLVAFGAGLRWFGTAYYYAGLDLLSLLPTLAGLAAVLGGRAGLAYAWPAVLFLGFMVPLPYQLHTALAGKLQRAATVMSTWALQTLGAPAVAEGNVILLNDARIGVVDACSGLGMVVTFAALSAAAAFLLKGSAVWVRAALLAGALPVAVLANVARITATGLFYQANQAGAARAVFHDLAGWLMMPVGAALVAAEWYVLEHLVTDAGPPGPVRGGPLRLPR